MFVDILGILLLNRSGRWSVIYERSVLGKRRFTNSGVLPERGVRKVNFLNAKIWGVREAAAKAHVNNIVLLYVYKLNCFVVGLSVCKVYRLYFNNTSLTACCY